MASTVLSNINFLSEPFKDVLAATWTHKLELFNALMSNAAGYITPDKGYTQAIPKWNTLSGDSVQITTATSTTINNVTDYKDVGIWVEREKAWGADQMLQVVAGRDATQAIASMIGEYWAQELHRIVAAKVLPAIYGSTLASTHVKDDSGAKINGDGIMDAKLKLGDNLEELQNIVLNSKVFGDAVKAGLVTGTPGQDSTFATGDVPSILGLRRYISDKLAATGGVYPSYIGQKGSIIYLTRPRPQNQLTNGQVYDVAGPNGINIQIELNREAKTGGGQDEIISRVSFLVHVPGVEWYTTGGVTSNPTDAELATTTNWVKVVSDDKLIKLVQYLSL